LLRRIDLFFGPGDVIAGAELPGPFECDRLRLVAEDRWRAAEPALALVIVDADGDHVELAGAHELRRDRVARRRIVERILVVGREETLAADLDAVEIRFVAVVDLLHGECEVIALPGLGHLHEAPVPGEAVVVGELAARGVLPGAGDVEKGPWGLRSGLWED